MVAKCIECGKEEDVLHVAGSYTCLGCRGISKHVRRERAPKPDKLDKLAHMDIPYSSKRRLEKYLRAPNKYYYLYR